MCANEFLANFFLPIIPDMKYQTQKENEIWLNHHNEIPSYLVPVGGGEPKLEELRYKAQTEVLSPFDQKEIKTK